MIPRVLLQRLKTLRRRERLLQGTWGLARWLALVLGMLVLACALDWALDQEEDTPWALRLALSLVQVLAAVTAAGYFVRPLLRRLRASALALWVEDKNPQLEHRLISAVQLNQPGAWTVGMSPELIATVTREAEEQIKPIAFPRVADHRRLKWSLALLFPVLLPALVPALLWPEVIQALVARQLLMDRDIPRSITIVSLTPEVWPRGEKVLLHFQASGRDLPAATGMVFIQPDGLPAEFFPLQFQQWTGEDQALLVCDVPSWSTDFRYRAWLGDGRMSRARRLQFLPRPVVVNLEAWVLLPGFCGKKPDGTRYQQSQARGDIAGIPGATARVQVQIQKPVRSAFIELLAGPSPEQKEPETGKNGPDIVRRRLPMHIDLGGAGAEGFFDLKTDESAYRVLVKDEHGFENVPPPRRSVRLIPEDPPQISLLREQDLFPLPLGLKDLPLEEVDLEGMPVPMGRPVRIGYFCTGPYGLGQARLLYRVLKKTAKGSEAEGDESWQVLPLVEVKAPEDAGLFLPQFGVFQKSGPRDQVPFHALPSPDPQRILGRTLGGGRFHFQTTGILDGKGGFLLLAEGDQIEYCLEVLADRDPKAGRPSARSETRVKTIVSSEGFTRWRRDLSQEQERLGKLEAQQGKLFSK